jgi:hypothetical protein
MTKLRHAVLILGRVPLHFVRLLCITNKRAVRPRATPAGLEKVLPGLVYYNHIAPPELFNLCQCRDSTIGVSRNLPRYVSPLSELAAWSVTSRQCVPQRNHRAAEPAKQSAHPGQKTKRSLHRGPPDGHELKHNTAQQKPGAPGKKTNRKPPAAGLQMPGDGTRKRTRDTANAGRHIPILSPI